MEINDKKLKRTSKIINWTIAIVLGMFLILLSNRVIDDLDTSVEYPRIDDFRNESENNKLEKERAAITSQIDALYAQMQNIRKMVDVAKENKEREQQSFDNWLATRTSLGRPDQDQEVLSRAKKLDEFLQVEQEWENKYNDLRSQLTPLQSVENDISDKESKLESEAHSLYEKEVKSYDIKVFLIRLLFVAPILALGIFFFIRYRKHKFRPLFMGFTLFSVYAFFVGLVPYLPSYGGYIRYTVGILLTIGLGYYAIKKIRDYSDRKRAELQKSAAERTSKLETGIAERAFNNHVCPSCGKDFLLKNWESKLSIEPAAMQLVSNYCRYCGLQLMKGCVSCGHLNYAHLPYCVECGSNLKS